MNTKILLLAISFISTSIYACEFSDNISKRDQSPSLCMRIANLVGLNNYYQHNTEQRKFNFNRKMGTHYNGICNIEKLFLAGALIKSFYPQNDNNKIEQPFDRMFHLRKEMDAYHEKSIECPFTTFREKEDFFRNSHEMQVARGHVFDITNKHETLWNWIFKKNEYVKEHMKWARITEIENNLNYIENELERRPLSEHDKEVLEGCFPELKKIYDNMNIRNNTETS